MNAEAALQPGAATASAATAPLPSNQKLLLDTGRNLLTVEDENGQTGTMDLYSPEAFDLLSRYWMKIGWQQKYTYAFTWMGRPVIQLPEDMIRTQEAIYRLQPDVIIETGVAHGGSLIFYASLCKAMGKGRVVGIDIEIRPHNRRAIEAHEMFPLITLVEGSSTDSAIVEQVRSLVKPGETVLIILDSCHTKAHVAAELAAYHSMVTPGSYIVATDGIMQDLADLENIPDDWRWDNPAEAAREFAAAHPEFVLEQPPIPFNEGRITRYVTHWPDAWLRRKV